VFLTARSKAAQLLTSSIYHQQTTGFKLLHSDFELCM